jgi:hypothetical protein
LLRLQTTHERRVALVAYIGENGDAFLPHPQNLQIVCSLEAGATNPETLIRLMKKGARVNQSDRLHMKVYWSSRKGAVICSANASSNALGKGALKEAGVWFPPGLVDINKLLQYADPKPVANQDLRELARRADLKAMSYSGGTRNATATITSLAEWLDSTASKPWKVGWWNSPTAIPAKAAKAQSYAHYGIKQPNNFVSCRKGAHKPGDWVLIFRVKDGRQASWLYVDFVVPVRSSEKTAYSKDYPFQAVQVHKSSRYPNPPFKLDSMARRAIQSAVRDFGELRFDQMKSVALPGKLRNLLVQYA